MARRRNPPLQIIMNETMVDKMYNLMIVYGDWELDILRNDLKKKNESQASLWLEANHKMVNFLQSIRLSVRDRLYDYLIDQAAINMKQFIEVLVIVLITLICCPALLFWYAFKSDRLMRKVHQFNKEIRVKVITNSS